MVLSMSKRTTTNIAVDNEVHQLVKAHTDKTGRKFKWFVEEALTIAVRREQKPKKVR